MAKLVTYLFLMTGLMLLFYFMGLTQCPNDNATCNKTVLGIDTKDPFTLLMDMLLRPENIQNSQLVVTVLAALGGISAMLTFIISKFISNLDMIITAPIAVLLLSLLWGFTKVIAVVASASGVLAALIFSPLVIVFIMSVYEWFRGMQ